MQAAAAGLKALARAGLAENVKAVTTEDGRPWAVEAFTTHDLAHAVAAANATDDDRARALRACLDLTWRHNSPSLENFAALEPILDGLESAANWAYGKNGGRTRSSSRGI